MTVKLTRLDLDGDALRAEAARSKDAKVARRLLALAAVRDGCNRTEAARRGGMDRQTLRDWVLRYNEAGLAGLSNRPHGGGTACKLTEAEQEQLARWVRQGPDPDDGVVRWRLSDFTAAHPGPVLCRAGRAQHQPDPEIPGLQPYLGTSAKSQGQRRGAGGAQKNFAGLVRDVIAEAARDKPVELWWQDEARIGQQGSLTYVWAERGTRPAAPRDQRYSWAYLFGAVCPERGLGAGLVLPCANTQAMNLHLLEISHHVAPGAHAVLILDGAAWHKPGGKLKVPDNISLLHLPPYSPELNPTENIWQFLRQNFLANRVFETHRAIVDACCDAWNCLIALPNTIRSIASRDYAKTVSSAVG